MHRMTIEAMRPRMFVRFRRGVVGEARRCVHLVALPIGAATPDVLTALCGQAFTAGQADVLPELTGMPCERCVAES